MSLDVHVRIGTWVLWYFVCVLDEISTTVPTHRDVFLQRSFSGPHSIPAPAFEEPGCGHLALVVVGQLRRLRTQLDKSSSTHVMANKAVDC